MQKHSLIGASLGTMIEYYDYAIFALFVAVIMPVITGQHHAAAALTSGFVVMLISQLLRPIGGLAFGYFGDRFGRKHTLIFAIVGISISTLLIGFLPGYAHIGSLAIALLILLKSIQIFCFGGEYNGAGVYVVEHAKPEHAYFWGSVLTAMTVLGALAASIIGYFLTLPSMPHNSWRMAFILGGVFGLLGIWYRRKMVESPVFLKDKSEPKSLVVILRTSWKAMLVAMAIGAFSTVPFTTIVVFINPFVAVHGLLTAHHMMLLQFVIIAFSMTALVLSGYLADRLGAKKVMLTGVSIVLFCALPSLLGLTHHNLIWIIIGELVLLLGNEMVLGPSNAYLTQKFSVHARYRGISLGFASGMALAGGLTPLIENELYHLAGNYHWLFIWPSAIALLAFVAIKR